MKKNFIIILVPILIFSVLGFLYTVSSSNKTEQSNLVTSSETVKIVELDQLDKSGTISATVVGYNSLKEMKEKADLIIAGRVIKVEKVSEFSYGSTIDIERTLKGKKISNILIYELADNNVLEENKEYILFLGKQNDDKANTYFVLGATQGAFIKDKDNTIYNNDKIMTEDIKHVKKNSKAQNDWDMLIEYIEQ